MSTYLITGITGHIGNVVASKLLAQGKSVVGLALPGDRCNMINCKIYYGDLLDKESMRPVFEQEHDLNIIHCAGKISVGSFDGLAMWNVNVNGTIHMLELAQEYKAAKFIYVSSVHAITEKPQGQMIIENSCVSSDQVSGDYARSKAEASRRVMEMQKKGLNACIVHPSGIIGPYDYQNGQMNRMFRAFLKGYIPIAVAGGYDFVDVRDVADGIISCIKKGKAGECYILSGHYIKIKDMLNIAAALSGRKKIKHCVSANVAKKTAPVVEKICKMVNKSPIYTPYSIETLASNGLFSNKKAEEELGFHIRPMEESIRDQMMWMKSQKKI